jgi:nucleolar protein 56
MDLLEKARAGVKKELAKRDRLLTHIVGSIEDNNKAANLLSERLVEWYGVYFPELRVPESRKFCQLVIELDRDNPDFDLLARVVGKDKAKYIEERARKSMGMTLNPEDLEAVRETAKAVLALHELRDNLERYQEMVAKEMAPNISYLVEPNLAAKLIARAGSVEKLARMPASTVQVLGAEKALFKHLKKHSKPPKHGLIFQHPLISTSPKKQRGKLSRALSTKIAIAAKADAYTGNFIAEKLKKDFEKRADAIRSAGVPKPQ